jgi:hypothetical protein
MKGSNAKAAFAWTNPGDDFENPQPGKQFIHGGGFSRLMAIGVPNDGIYLNRPWGEGAFVEHMGILGCGGNGIHVTGNGAFSTPFNMQGPFTIFSCNRALYMNVNLLTAGRIGFISGDGHKEAFLAFRGAGIIEQMGGKTEVLRKNPTKNIFDINWSSGNLLIHSTYVLFRKGGETSNKRGNAIVNITNFTPNDTGIALLSLRLRNTDLGCDELGYKGVVVNGQEIIKCKAINNSGPIILGTAKNAPTAFWKGFREAFIQPTGSIPE